MSVTTRAERLRQLASRVAKACQSVQRCNGVPAVFGRTHVAAEAPVGCLSGGAVHRGLHAAADPSRAWGLPPSAPAARPAPSRAGELAELGALLRAAGLGDAAVAAVASHLPGWPSLSRDPGGFRRRLAALVDLVGGDAALASEALAREPRLLTRVPDALRAEAAALGRLLGADARRVGRLVAAVPQSVAGLGATGVATQLDALAGLMGVPHGQAGSGGSGSGRAAPHPCAALLLRAPALLLQGPAALQQRLAGLGSLLAAAAAGGLDSGAAAGAAQPSPTAGAALRLAAAVVARRPELLLPLTRTLASRARDLSRTLGPGVLSQLCVAGDATTLAPLLLLTSEQARRRWVALGTMLPGLPLHHMLSLLGRRELRWEQLDYLRHAGVVPAWGAHHPHGTAEQQPEGEPLPSSGSSGGGGSSGGSSHSTAATAGQLHVGRLALCQDPAAFAAHHPPFPLWQALRQAVHAAPGLWGWRPEFDRHLVGPTLLAWLQGMRGRWARLLVARTNAHDMPRDSGKSGTARRRRAERRLGPEQGGGIQGPADELTFPSLHEVQAATEDRWAAVAASFPRALPPLLGWLPDEEALAMLRLGVPALSQRVAAHSVAWDALVGEVAEGPQQWAQQLEAWQAELPAALDAVAPAHPCAADGGSREHQRRQRVAAWWAGLLDEGTRTLRLQRLRYLARVAAGEGTGSGGSTDQPSQLDRLWPALVADDGAFAAAHPHYATWAAVASMANGRPAWQAELDGPAATGAALLAWLAQCAAGRLARLQYLCLADGGEAWRSCGLREAVSLGDDAFGEIFPDFRYGAWRLMLGPAAAEGAGAGPGPFTPTTSWTPGGEEDPAAAPTAPQQDGGAPREQKKRGRKPANAAAAARPASAALLADAPHVTDVAERCKEWRREARGWSPATWRRLLSVLRTSPQRLARAEFLLATHGEREAGGAAAGTGSTDTPGPLPPLAWVLSARDAEFDGCCPLFPLWRTIKVGAARHTPWRREFESWGPAQTNEALLAAIGAAVSINPRADGDPGEAATGTTCAGPGRWGAADIAAAAAVAERRLRFVGTGKRPRGWVGGLAGLLSASRAEVAERWPPLDPTLSAELEAQRAAALEAARREAEASFVGPHHLDPSVLGALSPRARRAVEGPRLAELQRLAHTAPATWEAALKSYRPRTLERLLTAPGPNLEYARYLAATGCQAGVAFGSAITTPAVWEEKDPGFRAWRRLWRLAARAPKWQQWWNTTRQRGASAVNRAVGAFSDVDDETWEALERAAAAAGGKLPRSPLRLLEQLRPPTDGTGSGGTE